MLSNTNRGMLPTTTWMQKPKSGVRAGVRAEVAAWACEITDLAVINDSLVRRLIARFEADDERVEQIAVGHTFPVRDPGLFTVPKGVRKGAKMIGS